MQSKYAGRSIRLTEWIDTYNYITEEWVLEKYRLEDLAHLRPRKDPNDFSDSDEDSNHPVNIEDALHFK